jgi:hypothetical protein
MRSLMTLLMLSTAGCSGTGPTDAGAPAPESKGQAPITLVNATADPLAFVAAGEGALALLDIPPRLEPGTYNDRLLAPGRSVPVTDIVGYDPKLGVNFFIWRVDRTTGVAHFDRIHLATADAVAASGGVVRITGFGL